MEIEERLVEGTFLGFSPVLAKIIGLNEAIFLNQLHYWKQRSKNERDGFVWVYKTYLEWQHELPFWSNATIRRVISSLEKQDLLVSTSEYNKMGIDKTKWYRINYENLTNLMTAQNEQLDCSNCTDDLLKMSNPCIQDEQTSCSERADDLLIMSNQTVQIEHTNNHRLLQDITSDNTTEITSKDFRTEKTDRQSFHAPSITNSVDREKEEKKKEKTVVGPSFPSLDDSFENKKFVSNLNRSEQIASIEKSIRFTFDNADEQVYKEIQGWLMMHSYELVKEAIKVTAQLEDPPSKLSSHILTMLADWKNQGISTYEQLLERQEQTA
ncbi:DnaD domain protein [Lysinibacillus capsici]|uniref:DnaD domain protein n=1 Tax=Lysinibacillus capsici TaxID=2115968 RepID=UPI00308125F6|nr:DnaD domain protein [Lysinibacillus capsici]